MQPSGWNYRGGLMCCQRGKGVEWRTCQREELLVP